MEMFLAFILILYFITGLIKNILIISSYIKNTKKPEVIELKKIYKPFGD